MKFVFKTLYFLTSVNLKESTFKFKSIKIRSSHFIKRLVAASLSPLSPSDLILPFGVPLARRLLLQPPLPLHAPIAENEATARHDQKHATPCHNKRNQLILLLIQLTRPIERTLGLVLWLWRVNFRGRRKVGILACQLAWPFKHSAQRRCN